MSEYKYTVALIVWLAFVAGSFSEQVGDWNEANTSTLWEAIYVYGIFAGTALLGYLAGKENS